MDTTERTATAADCHARTRAELIEMSQEPYFPAWDQLLAGERTAFETLRTCFSDRLIATTENMMMRFTGALEAAGAGEVVMKANGRYRGSRLSFSPMPQGARLWWNRYMDVMFKAFPKKVPGTVVGD